MSKQEYPLGNIVATFEVVSNKRKVHLKSNILGGLYYQWEDGQARSYNIFTAKWDSDNVKSGEMDVIQSPYPMYHCWHVCFCDDCAKVGGRTFDHSQGTWNDHLRRVPTAKMVTFPTAKQEMKI